MLTSMQRLHFGSLPGRVNGSNLTSPQVFIVHNPIYVVFYRGFSWRLLPICTEGFLAMPRYSNLLNFPALRASDLPSISTQRTSVPHSTSLLWELVSTCDLSVFPQSELSKRLYPWTKGFSTAAGEITNYAETLSQAYNYDS